MILLITLRTFTEYGNIIGTHYSFLDVANKAIGVLVIIFALVTFISRPMNHRNNYLTKVLFFTLILCVLNGLKNFEFDLSLATELVRLISIYCFYIIALRFVTIPNTVIRVFILFACTTPGTVVILTYLSGLTVFRADGIRATGMFSHPNSAAAYLGVSAIVCLSIFLQERKIRIFIFFLLNIIAIGITQSLTALVAVVMAMSLGVLNDSRVKQNIKIVLTSGIVLFTLLFSIKFVSKIGELFKIDYTTILIGGSVDSSIGWRVLNWSLYLKQWEKSPILGFGPGSASAHFTPLGQIPHSGIVQLLVEYGLAGLIVGFSCFLIFVWQLHRLKQRDGLGIFISLPVGTYLAIMSLTSNILTYTATLYLTAFALGIASQTNNLAKDKLKR